MSEHPLDPIFHPRTVALFGAPSNPDAWGSMFHKALLDTGFDRNRIFLINPKADEIDGLPCYPSLTAVPERIDHVISLVPARVVPELVEQCIAKRVRSLHLFTAGFSETGDEKMAEVERDSVARLKAAGIRTIGPNCMGLYVPASGLTFGSEFPMDQGNVFLVSQSGANASEIVRTLSPRGVRFSKVVSFGNGADLRAHDFFDYAASDADSEIVISYLEGVPEGRKLFAALQHCAAAKPTIILKGGLSGAGARAASSHTGSLAGSREIFEAVCRQTGALRVESMEELQDLTVAVATRARGVRGRRVVLVGGPGGFAVLSSDIIAGAGLDLPETPEEAKRELREFIPVAGTSVNNPIDAHPRGKDQMERTMRTLGGSGTYDIIFTTSLGPDPWRHGRRNRGSGGAVETPEEREKRLSDYREKAEEGARLLARLQEEIGIPIVHVQRGGGETAEIEASAAFAAGIGSFPSVARAAHAVRRLLEWRERRRGLPEVL